ncbi:MAG TPA: hypothetical protein VHX61_05565 [Rhizomicrobium sp.]|jgi:hypothetical protein|nr:hypothetical protein [Rhizomicrobium sp.]
MEVPKVTDEIELRLKLVERGAIEVARRVVELEQALQGLMAGEQITSLPEPVAFDADAVAPFAAGFHAQEIDASGRPFRWTDGDDYFELRFYLDRNLAWNFRMQIMPNSVVNVFELRAFVDHAEVPVRFEESGALVRGSIPARQFSRIVTLTFFLPSSFVPSRRDPESPDHRSLGVVFYGLNLEPMICERVQLPEGGAALPLDSAASRSPGSFDGDDSASHAQR